MRLETDENGNTRLHIYATNGDKNLRKLIEQMKESDQNASVDVKNNQGCTPLHYAAGEGVYGCVDYIV